MTTTMSFFRPSATTDQKLAILELLLANLPKPSPDNAGIAVRAYLVALDGVSEAALDQAFQWALQGRHGSLFAPWPTELRKLCDEAEQPYLDEIAKLKRQEQMAAERVPPIPERTPEEIERHKERMRRFYELHDQAKADLVKQFPKPAPLRRFEPPPRIDVNPPDWEDGQPLKVTPVLLRKLKRYQEMENTP